MGQIVEIPMPLASGKTTTALAMLRGFLASGKVARLLVPTNGDASYLLNRHKELPRDSIMWAGHLQFDQIHTDVLIVDDAERVDQFMMLKGERFMNLSVALQHHIERRQQRTAFLFTPSFK
jgi:hypothetical protein